MLFAFCVSARWNMFILSAKNFAFFFSLNVHSLNLDYHKMFEVIIHGLWFTFVFPFISSLFRRWGPRHWEVEGAFQMAPAMQVAALGWSSTLLRALLFSEETLQIALKEGVKISDFWSLFPFSYSWSYTFGVTLSILKKKLFVCLLQLCCGSVHL